MTGKRGGFGSDLAKVDAYENTAADYDEVPELTDEDFALGTWQLGSKPVSPSEGQTAMAAKIRPRGRPALTGGKEHVNLRVDRDVMAAFRATGPGWQSRMNDALRKAAGL